MYITHSASEHTGVKAHTCLHHHLPPAVSPLCGLGKDLLARLNSQHALGWKGSFLAGFGGAACEQRIMKEHGGRGGNRKKLPKASNVCSLQDSHLCVWPCGDPRCGMAQGLPVSPPLPFPHLYFPFSSSSSPACFILPYHCHMPWKCQELLPPGSWASLLAARPPWG